MNYFDDLKITCVLRAISCRDSSCIGPHPYYGLGVMNGKDYVKRVFPDSTIVLKTPFVYLIAPSSRSGWLTVGGSQRDNRWFIMEGSRGERLIASLMEIADPKTYTIALKNYSDLLVIHQKMLQLFHSVTPEENYKLAIYAERFAGAIYDGFGSAETQAPIYELINKVSHMITENPGKIFDFESLAREYQISYYHFRRCFVESMGIPLHEFVLQKRFSLAVSLLKNGTQSIKEISDLCGFQNPSDFSRFIKSRCSSTPSELRKQNQFTEI
ncbi:MAG: helix-turn-helix transcriptional regulator [Lentisphaeria bacterium]|nr:helix-turn-helix transcriptional regulator [Lentisphaeria bacterium]